MLHCKINRYLKLIACDLLITRDVIIDVVAESYNDVSNTVSVNLNDKKAF